LPSLLLDRLRIFRVLDRLALDQLARRLRIPNRSGAGEDVADGLTKDAEQVAFGRVSFALDQLRSSASSRVSRDSDRFAASELPPKVEQVEPLLQVQESGRGDARLRSHLAHFRDEDLQLAVLVPRGRRLRRSAVSLDCLRMIRAMTLQSRRRGRSAAVQSGDRPLGNAVERQLPEWTFRKGLVQPLDLLALVSPKSFTARTDDDDDWRDLDLHQLDQAFASTSLARRAYRRNRHAPPTEP
jgi:hypothetical protein